MFDNVIIDLSILPVTEEERKSLSVYDDNWQTKDLENLLDTYYINSDRELLKHFTDLGHALPIDYTGLIKFYNYKPNNHWWEFDAQFVNGLMVEIKGGNLTDLTLNDKPLNN